MGNTICNFKSPPDSEIIKQQIFNMEENYRKSLEIMTYTMEENYRKSLEMHVNVTLQENVNSPKISDQLQKIDQSLEVQKSELSIIRCHNQELRELRIENENQRIRIKHFEHSFIKYLWFEVLKRQKFDGIGDIMYES